MNNPIRKLFFVAGVLVTLVCGFLTVWVFFCGVVEGDPGGIPAFAIFATSTVAGMLLVCFFRPKKDLSEAQEKEQALLSLYSKLMRTGGWSRLSGRDWNAYHKYRDDFLRRFSADLRDKGIVLPESKNEGASSNKGIHGTQ